MGRKTRQPIEAAAERKRFGDSGAPPFQNNNKIKIKQGRDTLKIATETKKELYEMYLTLPYEDKLKFYEMLLDLRRRRVSCQPHQEERHLM